MKAPTPLQSVLSVIVGLALMIGSLVAWRVCGIDVELAVFLALAGLSAIGYGLNIQDILGL